MDIKRMLKGTPEQPPKKRASGATRRQFNVVIHHSLIEAVKRLAAHLAVTGSPIVEHGLQVGLRAMAKTIDDPERREQLRQHLIEGHRLSRDLDESDEAHLVDTRYAPDVLRLSRELVVHTRNLQRFIKGFQEGGVRLEVLQNCRDAMFDAAYALAERVTSFPLDEEKPPAQPGSELGRFLRDIPQSPRARPVRFEDRGTPPPA